MAELQSADVRSDGPAVFRLDTRRVRVHDAIAIRDYVEKMSDRRIAQPRNMVGGRLWKTAQYYHPIPATCAVVAFGTHRVETFPTPGQQFGRQLYRQLRNISSIR